MENAHKLDPVLLRRVCAANPETCSDADMMALMFELADSARFTEAAKLLDFLALLGVAPSDLVLDTKTSLDKRCKAALRRAAGRHGNMDAAKIAKSTGADGADQATRAAQAPNAAADDDRVRRQTQGAWRR